MRICIVGAGYVGLVSAACFAETGNDVYCVDSNPKVIEQLSGGQVHIFEPGLEELVRRNYAGNRLKFSVSLKEGLRRAQCVFICVGTPPRPDGSCDLAHVEKVADEIGSCMTAPLVIVDKSTVPVGTADLVKDRVAASLARRGASFDFEVVSNPEFLKEGDAVSDFMKPDRIILGTGSAEAASLLREIYAPFARSREKVMIMSVRSAEMTKYAANCMLATKISFINEIAGLCELVGADVRDVRQGVGADHRIGHHFIYPGLGYGGSCFPKDVKALIHTARSVDFEPMLLDAVEKVNERQKRSMATRIKDYFDPLGGVAGRTLALWGLAFKANTDDVREAAALEVIRDLSAAGMRICAFDPQAMQNAARALGGNAQVTYANDQYEACAGADALLIATEWNQFRTPDFERVRDLLKVPLIFDGRNLYDPQRMDRLGFTYFCVGLGRMQPCIS